jgi:hypothetical protein
MMVGRWLLFSVLWIGCAPQAPPTRDTPEEPIGGEDDVSSWASEPLVEAGRIKLRGALIEAESFEPQLRPRFAATALANAMRGRIAPPLVEALNLVQQSELERAPLILLKPFEQFAISLAWKKSCKLGVRALADAITLPPEQRAVAVYEACKLERSQFITLDEARTADASALAVATLIHDRLKERDALSEEELRALRMFALGSLVAFHDIAPLAPPDAGVPENSGSADPSAAVSAPVAPTTAPSASTSSTKPAPSVNALTTSAPKSPPSAAPSTTPTSAPSSKRAP